MVNVTTVSQLSLKAISCISATEMLFYSLASVVSLTLFLDLYQQAVDLWQKIEHEYCLVQQITINTIYKR